MNRSQMELIVKISETGSFTKAGEELNMTQPAVSRAVATFESQLGTKLIIRSKKNGIIFTDIGERILILFRNILDQFVKVDELISLEKGLEIGKIRIGGYPTACTNFIPQIIRVMKEEHPNLEISLHEGSVDEVREWLRSRIIDVGIIIPPNEEFDIVPLVKDEFVIVIGKDHPLSRTEKICLKDITEEDMLLVKGGYEIPIYNLFEEAGLKLNVKFAVHHLDTALSMANEGLGFVITTNRSILFLPDNCVVRKLETEVRREVNIAAVSFNESSNIVNYFIKTAKDIFSNT
ncbi:LysR family transcriptional regulator [Metabacillus fastidiosus]|uniref:LysR family transcriptional regulator n=1 Tax=Metabacillus fastidiosus TaxID=1458 RepID=UPI002DB89D1B|nr:LysR family transcriptional regulator [Metabacillus fastidiosus]MEC2078555.1 LysR family transcriptional regulator [Metabacillus fastidiosus]